MTNNYDPSHFFCQYPISLNIVLFQLLYNAETRTVDEEGLTSMLTAKRIHLNIRGKQEWPWEFSV